MIASSTEVNFDNDKKAKQWQSFKLQEAAAESVEIWCAHCWSRVHQN
jgi:hypothetical protein